MVVVAERVKNSFLKKKAWILDGKKEETEKSSPYKRTLTRQRAPPARCRTTIHLRWDYLPSRLASPCAQLTGPMAWCGAP